MGRRRKSRELLLQLLFQAEWNKPQDIEHLLKDFWEDFPTRTEVSERAQDLFLKIMVKRDEIDQRVEDGSENWKLSRMSCVDRNILRAAAYELFYCDDVPAEVAMNEAIEIAKRYGTESSGVFVNGILDKIWNSRSRH